LALEERNNLIWPNRPDIRSHEEIDQQNPKMTLNDDKIAELENFHTANWTVLGQFKIKRTGSRQATRHRSGRTMSLPDGHHWRDIRPHEGYLAHILLAYC